MQSTYGIFLILAIIILLLLIVNRGIGWKVFSSKLTSERSKSLHGNKKLVRDLRKAVKQEQLTLYYQPILNNNEQIVSMEALLRWEHPKFGFVSPETIIQIAEHEGIIVELGEWILKTACKQAKKWHQNGKEEISVAVNVSPTQLNDVEFIDKLVKILEETSLEPKLLELEITENVNLLGIKNIRSRLYQLKAVGVVISIDDFGTGFASLQYLNQLPVDRIKIDKQFVMDINPDDRMSSAIAKNVISLAEKLNLDVVAEGVESSYQYNLLSRGYCSRFQGYYFYKPLDSVELERITRNHLEVEQQQKV